MKISNLSSKQVIVLVSTIVVTLALGSVAYAIFSPQANSNRQEETVMQDNESSKDNESRQDSEQTETPNTSEETELPTSPMTTFGDGTYRVGFDIVPGTYESTDPSSTCHHEKRSGDSVSSSDVNVSSNGDSETRTTVTISDGDETFTTEGCGTWTKTG